MSAPGRPSSSSVRCSRGGGNAVAERRSRGAPLGDALAEVARRTGMSEADALDRVLARSAWKSTVAVRIGAGTSRLKWSKTPFQPSTTLAGCVTPPLSMLSTARDSFWTTRHPPRLSAPTATGALPCEGSAVITLPPVPPWRRWRRLSTSTSRRRAGSRARGRTIGGRGGWSSHGRWRARRPELADRAGVEVRPGASPAVSAPPAALRG
jgi:hypothetical protein